MDKNQLIRRLMATFVGELEEHVRALNQDLLVLEQAATEQQQAESFKALFRTAHSMKGAARSVDVHSIETACHRMEDTFTAVQQGRLPLGPGLFELLFAAADAIEETGQRLREQADLKGSPLEAILPRLAETAEGRAPASAAPPQATGGPPLPAPQKSNGNSPAAAVEPARAAPPAAAAPAATASPAPNSEVSAVAPPPGDESPPPRPAASQKAPAAAPVSRMAADAAPTALIRVAAEKLDALLAQSGELLVARRRVESRVDDVSTLRDFVAAWRMQSRDAHKSGRKVVQPTAREEKAPGAGNGDADAAALRRLEKDLERLAMVMVSDGRQLEQACNALEGEVHRVRMLPFEEACQGLGRAIRDVAQAGGKEVQFVLKGSDVEMDRSILEGLKDPLLHLVRNAVDHGVETPDERRRAGKPPQAQLTVAAALRGAQVEVVVSDDGKGIDVEAVRRQVRKRGLPEPADERELIRMIFHPGFSTAKIITDVSGRGVGLDVVKSRLESLHGTVEISSDPGRARFTLAVPLTLTTLRVLMFVAAGQTFALGSTAVQKLVRVGVDDFRTVQGREVITIGGAPIPIVSVADMLGLKAPAKAAGAGPDRAVKNEKLPAIIVKTGDTLAAFVVDELIVEQEVVVKNLGRRIRRVRNVSGASLLPTGKIALVLNAVTMVRSALRRGSAQTFAASLAETGPQAKNRLLVVDDSVTTRSLVKSILEASGYQVTVAVDGMDAWKTLEEQGADLVVSDVEMPRMDGFTLTETIRSSKRFAELPVILVTALDSEQHKAHGIEVGADAYLVKSAFDQRNLLQTISQLL